MSRISDHITYKEATNSYTAKRKGIENKPNDLQLRNMRLLAEVIFEPLRKALGGSPIYIASFFRSEKLNEEIGGADNSQHMANEGAAIDLDNDGYEGVPNNKEIFDYIKDNLPFDQLIYEFGTDENPGWVHVSYNIGNNRNQILRAKKVNDKTIYEEYAQ